MRIDIHGKQLDVTEAIREYVEQRIERIEHLLDHSAKPSAQFKLSVIKYNHIVETTIHIGEYTIRVEESSDDMYKSIDMAQEKLKRKIRKLKTKLNHGKRVKIIPEIVEAEIEEDYQVVRVKRFDVKPMSQEEAILQMNLLEHTFYVFKNEDTNEMGVVYIRNKGEYGVIEASSI
ncbi:ribosome hibernation-promoting factor, HPF/YfiA family [Bacillus suaedaesalsae]|uniref:Ribosome hibernation promoting factor n=1 Tax=Bacillus suaedaesalsae TaxID=2810349 RepID=A0ABS2DEW9_9BACI|nr:ribosome-associated translation inhibitor RaiA [Bacillus suaedaesalsae]MBM6617005.1 ribosome-associated translation inhibitor RaiA [Bacillus suaedaesalsae]